MPAPEDVERGAQNRTLKPKDVNHLGPQVLEGIRMLEEGARKMRERAGKEAR